ncbi:MAG: hypothetical protein LQ347_004622 [Umbilicaria vellea]|nr:MAG: hypothetical protein LQ347_004622 [Umbilicaria vellea]
MSGSLNEARVQLQAHFSGPESEHPDRWSKLWDAGDFLPWDRGLPQPALADLLSDRHDLIGKCYVEDGSGGQRRKKALVPGCGRGYDVLLLASFGYDAYGLEVSESATQRCEEEQANNAHKYPVRDEAVGAGTATFLNGNFFEETWLKEVDGEGKFELMFDYTASLTLTDAACSCLMCLRCDYYRQAAALIDDRPP